MNNGCATRLNLHVNHLVRRGRLGPCSTFKCHDVIVLTQLGENGRQQGSSNALHVALHSLSRWGPDQDGREQRVGGLARWGCRKGLCAREQAW